jgi:predicted alpha/beta-fold hydrolase
MDEQLAHYALNYECSPQLAHPWVQTIIADTLSSFSQKPLPFCDEIIELEGGDRLLCALDTPDHWNGERSCILLPGLTGHAESPYMLRLTCKLLEVGVQCMRVNYRSCGRGIGLSNQVFHAGQSPEIYQVVAHLRRKFPQTRIDMIGFSIGGNLMLKMAGENDTKALGVERILAVSPPVDLVACCKTIEQKGRIFSRYFCKRLLKFLDQSARLNPNLKLPLVAKAMRQRMKRIMDFDEHFIVPMFGFRDTLEYYQRARSSEVLTHIDCDASILLADDDPIVDYRSIHHPSMLGAVKLYLTRGGGHVGFLRRGGLMKNPFWMDDFIMLWSSLAPKIALTKEHLK